MAKTPNPYAADALTTEPKMAPASWGCRFAVLNCLLIAVPAIIIGVLYLAMKWVAGMSMQLSGSSGTIGPDTWLALAAYPAIPNAFLLVRFLLARRRKTS